jgi:nicotinate-nucleotide adenylyltransferase
VLNRCHYDGSMAQALSQARRVAFFGGSFDPPHLGHLAIARAARSALRLDLVLFAPVGAQPLKPRGSSAAYEQRMAMTELAIAGEPGFAVSSIDAPNPDGRPNYTLGSLERLRADLAADAELFCLMGADSFASLKKWHGAAELPFAASLIVASRPGESLDHVTRQVPDGISAQPNEAAPSADPSIELRGYTLRDSGGRTAMMFVLPGLDVKISASEIRAQIQAGNGGSTREFVPRPVADYIRSHGLYA